MAERVDRESRIGRRIRLRDLHVLSVVIAQAARNAVTSGNKVVERTHSTSLPGKQHACIHAGHGSLRDSRSAARSITAFLPKVRKQFLAGTSQSL